MLPARPESLESAAVPPPEPALWLASRSPRRRELLDEAGVAHSVIEAAGVDDSELRPGRTTPASWVAALAWLKAAAGADAVAERGQSVILAADTLCALPGLGLRGLLGQPAHPDEARRTIRRLRQGRHEVLTGVALYCMGTGVRDVFVDRAAVSWGAVSDAEIDLYVASGAWRGKAGGYNLRERIDAGWPIEFDGDPTSIMGLPMRALGPRLARFGIETTGPGCDGGGRSGGSSGGRSGGSSAGRALRADVA
ncbi:MAG: Maf family protein [Planctomycetota bacterium]